MLSIGTGFLKNLIWIFLALFGLSIITGCTTTLQNQGDVGFKFSTEWAFFHRAAKTSGDADSDVAKSNTDVPALVEWFLEGPPPPPVTETPN